MSWSLICFGFDSGAFWSLSSLFPKRRRRRWTNYQIPTRPLSHSTQGSNTWQIHGAALAEMHGCRHLSKVTQVLYVRCYLPIACFFAAMVRTTPSSIKHAEPLLRLGFLLYVLGTWWGCQRFLRTIFKHMCSLCLVRSSQMSAGASIERAEAVATARQRIENHNVMIVAYFSNGLMIWQWITLSSGSKPPTTFPEYYTDS